MTQALVFLSIVLVSVCLAAWGAARDTYHQPAMAVLLSAFRALSIIVLATLAIFWNWEKAALPTQSVTGLILVDEAAKSRSEPHRSAANLLKKIRAQGGRPVLLTYNSTGDVPGIEAAPWQRFQRFENALFALGLLQDRHGPLPIAVFSDEHPGRFLTEREDSWDITWIDGRENPPLNRFEQILYPEQVFMGQPFRVNVTVSPRAGAAGLTSGLNGTILEKIPLQADSQNEIPVELDLTLKQEGHSSLELTLYDEENTPIAMERLPVLAVPKSGVVYISPYGTAAPLSKILAGSGFDVMHVPPGRALRNPEKLVARGDGYRTLIVLDSIPLPYMRPALASRLTEMVRGQGASLLFIPGADIESGFMGNPLERLLPVHLGRTDDPDEKDGLAFVAIVDTSMSMFYTARGAAGHGAFGPNPSGPVSKIQMAKKALENLSSAIDEEDRFGILTVRDSPSWVMKPSAKRDPASEAGSISRIYAMGPGINLYSGLLAAYNELVTINTRVKHVLIFLDTADVDEYQVSDRGTVWELLENFRSEEITISLVGFGKPDDQHIPQLNRFAEEAGGYFYLTSELEEIPGFGLKDLQQVKDNPVTLQRRKVKFFQHDFTGVRTFPDLKGQVITTLKPGAALYAWTDAELPLFTAWPYGKGRVGVFGADSGIFLARDWTAAADKDAWLSLILKLTVPAEASPELFYSKDPEGGYLVFLTTDSAWPGMAFTAQGHFSRRSLPATGLERIGSGKYVTRIEDHGTPIRSISVSGQGNSLYGTQVTAVPERTRTARPLSTGEFVPHPPEKEDHPEPSAEPEALRLFILLALLLFIVDEFFRPPGMERLSD